MQNHGSFTFDKFQVCWAIVYLLWVVQVHPGHKVAHDPEKRPEVLVVTQRTVPSVLVP